MKTALLAFAPAALWLAPASGFVRVTPGPIQRHQTAKHTHLPPTRRRRDRPSTALALASGAEVTELREKFRINRAPPTRFVEKLYTETFGSGRPATNRVQTLFGPLGADGPDYFAASIKFQMWLSVSSLVSFASQILLRDAAALSAGTAGVLGRVPLEMGVFGFFCLLNVLELALVPTTFLNLGLIEVVEDFVERQGRAEDDSDTPYAIDAPQ